MKQVLIIAEVGVNHNGSLELARKLVEVAADAGADIVKFQTFKAEKLTTKAAGKAAYQVENTGNNQSQFDMLKQLELPHDYHFILKDYCAQKGIVFLSTPFDIDSIDFLKAMGITIGKISSGEVTNYPFLKAMAEAFPRIILSTGMANINEVKTAVSVLLEHGTAKENLSILHCNTEYPTPMEDVNLKAMLDIKEQVDVEVGYSDHTEGIEVAIAAVALGATIIEKHFTLDKEMEGPDHKASMNPKELEALVKAIRNIEKAIGGSGKKCPSASEIKNIEIVRKSIVCKLPIRKGDLYSNENLTVKRPATGLSPMNWTKLIGQAANKDYQPDDLIEL